MYLEGEFVGPGKSAEYGFRLPEPFPCEGKWRKVGSGWHFLNYFFVTPNRHPM